LNQGDK
jgi:hypothetical protein